MAGVKGKSGGRRSGAGRKPRLGRLDSSDAAACRLHAQMLITLYEKAIRGSATAQMSYLAPRQRRAKSG